MPHDDESLLKICVFQAEFSALSKSETFRNEKYTKWDFYRNIVIGNLTRLEECDSTSELGERICTLTNILKKAYYIASNPVHAKRGSKPP